MAQFAYRIQPTRVAMLASGPTADEARIVGEHFDYLKALTEDGLVLMAGRTLSTDEHSFGIVVLEAQSEPAARELSFSSGARPARQKREAACRS